MPDSCMLAHRRVACAAKPPGLDSGSAHVEDATEEIEDEREEREDTSETMDSGDDRDELDRARDDLRADVGNGCGKTGRHDGFGLSNVMRAVHAFWTCCMAMLMEVRRGQRPSAPTAGVLKVVLKPFGCGVSLGVGKGPRRGRAGRIASSRQVARGVGSNVRGIWHALVGVGSFEFDEANSWKSATGEQCFLD